MLAIIYNIPSQSIRAAYQHHIKLEGRLNSGRCIMDNIVYNSHKNSNSKPKIPDRRKSSRDRRVPTVQQPNFDNLTKAQQEWRRRRDQTS